MAKYRVRPSETNTTGFLLTAADRLTVAFDGAIVRADGPAATILGADVTATVLNFGVIQNTAAGFAVSGSLSGVVGLRIFNESDGRIEGGAGGITLASDDGTTGTVLIDNEGVIDGNSSNAFAMRDLLATTVTVINREGGLITNSGASDVVRPGDDSASDIVVKNYGVIQAGTIDGATSGGDGVDLQSKDGGRSASIFNYGDGLIEGGKHAITGGNGARIYNEGTLTGRNGSGVNFDTESADGDGAVSVVNYGTITGAYDGFGDGDGDGVDVDYLVDVRNFGTIQGIGADNIDDFGDGVAAGGGIIRNLFGGTIFGETNGVLIDDGDRNGAYAATRIINDGIITGTLGYGVRLIGDFADAVTNRGTIEATDRAAAALDMGGGDDAVVNEGDINGDVLLGDGNDSFRGGTILGAIDGGAGDDTIAGGAQNDTIVGGLGFDQMSGGRGVDTYVFADIAETNVKLELSDIITFGQTDVIDLSGIDGDIYTAGDQAFTLNLTGVATGEAGDLLFTQVEPGLATLGGDINGDGNVDFLIRLQGVDDPAVLTITF